ncbi:MAG: ribonuclease H-like domain-containing protein [Candidatus Pacearchaeota archaeon]|nr:ribonuclease H-like domain-containing protein [Candidatus Pacearchaeota archaeon]
MPSYYLDIETTGLNPKVDKIITIQYQQLDRTTGEAIGELIILKEWELGEREMLKKFIIDSKILDAYAFSFVAVGYNLTFEHNFLKERSRFHDLPEIDIVSKPFIDLRAVGILMNNGEFKGSGLDKLTGKKRNGAGIPEWFLAKEYENIIGYIVNEAEEFVKFNVWLYANLPKLHEKFREEILGK